MSSNPYFTLLSVFPLVPNLSRSHYPSWQPVRGIVGLVLAVALAIWFHPHLAAAQSAKADWQTEWDKVLEAAKKEGKVAMVMGLTYYSYLPFLKAGLPIKPLPTPKEGTYGTGGSGNLAIIKKPPHPNATKVFVNWILGKEGQEIFGKAMGMGTRRLDVDTQWLEEFGVLAAKDKLTLKQYLDWENQSEEKLEKVREPASKVAQKLFD